MTLLEWLTGLRENTCVHQFIKGYDEEYKSTATWKENIGWVPKQRNFCPCGLWGLAQWQVEVFQFSESGGSPKKTRKLSFWVSTEASWHSPDWLSHWPLARWNSIPSPLPQGWGWEWKFQHSDRMVHPRGNQSLPLGGIQKSPSLIVRHEFHLFGSEVFSGTVSVDQIYLRKRNLVTQMTEWPNLYFLEIIIGQLPYIVLAFSFTKSYVKLIVRATNLLLYKDFFLA